MPQLCGPRNIVLRIANSSSRIAINGRRCQNRLESLLSGEKTLAKPIAILVNLHRPYLDFDAPLQINWAACVVLCVLIHWCIQLVTLLFSSQQVSIAQLRQPRKQLVLKDWLGDRVPVFLVSQ